MKDYLGMLISLLVLAGVLMFAGFYGGRRYEKQFWAKYYYSEMNKTCLECAGLKNFGGSYDGTPN